MIGGYPGWMLVLMAVATLLLLAACGYAAMRMRARKAGPKTGRGAAA
jgi:hypothetical protein